MPFTNNGGVRIHYDTFGGGPPIVLHHGTTGSGANWIEFGYVDALKADHQIILLDARGHGDSDKPHDPAAYDLALRASDVVAVLDALGIATADYFGYSMGGWIGFGVAKHAPQRFRSFILGGAHPYPENMQPFRDFMPRDHEAFSKVLDQVFGGRLTAGARALQLTNDLEALRTLTQDRVSNADVLPLMTMPCLLYVGEADPRFAQVKQCAAEMPSATFFSLPDSDHVGTMMRIDVVVPQIKAFLARIGG
jgi:pimeloyl-ACP methyl ester carboxylesterase